METKTLPQLPGIKYFKVEELDKKYHLKDEFWETAYGRKIPVRKMKTAHILNCINCFNGNGNMRIPSDYLGGRKKWLKIFNEELTKRQ